MHRTREKKPKDKFRKEKDYQRTKMHKNITVRTAKK